ncbi:diguanylate cyclase [Agaribacter flavus]|uniref:diguanylate cyclase n=1 Tax=Agaribacter flavus TaxID=1902781 RepID=A0ABV7FU53_9ALTE
MSERHISLKFNAAFIAVALLCLLVLFNLNQMLHHYTKSGELINISGQQRMLSQRSTLLTIEYIRNSIPDTREQAIQAQEKMLQNLAFLLSGNISAPPKYLVLSDTLRTFYYDKPHDVKNRVHFFIDTQVELLNNEALSNDQITTKVDFIQAEKDALLNSLDMLVQQYEKESAKTFASLYNQQRTVIFILIITVLLEGFLIFRPALRKYQSLNRKLKTDAYHDTLTKLANRHGLNEFGEAQLKLVKEEDKECSVILCDIDRFKAINDKYGHVVGDNTLVQFSQIVVETVRHIDFVARFGGEEFIIVLPDTNVNGAKAVAEKIRKHLQQKIFSIDKTTIQLTASFGVAQLQASDDDFMHAITCADKALYTSKQSGRNTVSPYVHNLGSA